METNAEEGSVREVAMPDPGSLALKRGRSSSPEAGEKEKQLVIFQPKPNPKSKPAARRPAKKKGSTQLLRSKPASRVSPSDPCLVLLSDKSGDVATQGVDDEDGLVLVPIGVSGTWTGGSGPTGRKGGSPGRLEGSNLGRVQGANASSNQGLGGEDLISAGEETGKKTGVVESPDREGAGGSAAVSSPSKIHLKANLARLTGSGCCWGSGTEGREGIGRGGTCRTSGGSARGGAGPSVTSTSPGGKGKGPMEVGGREKLGGRVQGEVARQGRRGVQVCLGASGKARSSRVAGDGGEQEAAKPGSPVTGQQGRERSRSPRVFRAGEGARVSSSTQSTPLKVKKQPPVDDECLSRIQRAISDSANDEISEASAKGKGGGAPRDGDL